MNRQPNGASQPGPAWPPVDLVRENGTLLLTVALPGVRADDFRIALAGNRQVRIEGTVPYRHPVPPESLAQAEQFHGPFSRTVALPLPVDAAGATVRFEQGVLTARLPLRLEPVSMWWERSEGDSDAESS